MTNLPMKHASINDLDEIYAAFREHKTWFPHIRKSYVKSRLEENTIIDDCDTIIIYRQYSRKNQIDDFGHCIARKGDYVLKQILKKSDSAKPNQAMSKFLNCVNATVFLTVRAENDRAINFYRKHGWKRDGEVSWSKGKVAGLVFKYDPENMNFINSNTNETP